MLSKFVISISRNYAANPYSFYDVVIVGGGLVGSAMACLIGKNPWLKDKKVLLLDSGRLEYNTNDGIYSNRISAIRLSSIELFKKFGIWKHIQERAHPITALYVEDGSTGSNITFRQHNEQSHIAYMVENDLIIEAMHKILKNDCPNVEYKQESPIENLSIPENLLENVYFKSNNGKNMECSLLIAADGAKSKVREMAGIKYTVQDYDQMAIVATLQLSPPTLENTMAWQRFMPLGPVAILPIAKDLSSLVWTTSTSEAKKLLKIPKESFLNELNKTLFDTTGYNQNVTSSLDTLTSLFNVLPICKQSAKLKFPYILSFAYDNDNRAAFPLSYICTKNNVGHRIALIGDAAHRVHPLAGQGVNLGWSDVVELANILESTVKEGGDLGSITYLKHYDTETQRRNGAMITAIDSLNYLFCSNFGPYIFLRSFGFNILDRFSPAKDLIFRIAS